MDRRRLNLVENEGMSTPRRDPLMMARTSPMLTRSPTIPMGPAMPDNPFLVTQQGVPSKRQTPPIHGSHIANNLASSNARAAQNASDLRAALSTVTRLEIENGELRIENMLLRRQIPADAVVAADDKQDTPA